MREDDGQQDMWCLLQMVSLVERIVLKDVPKMSRHVPKTFPKSSSSQSSCGTMSQTCLKKMSFPKMPQTLSQLNSQNRVFTKWPRVYSQFFPNPWFPKDVPNKLLKDVPNNDVQSDTVSRCGPRGLYSNTVQRSRNNDGIACTHRAFNNTARANCYCGRSSTGHKPKVVRWEEASSWGQCIAQGRRA
jgi:hypothetical protein